MGEVVKLRRARKETIRGAARSCLTSALDAIPDAHGVVIVALGLNGKFAVRTANYDSLKDFDMFSRAGATIEQDRMRLLDSE